MRRMETRPVSLLPKSSDDNASRPQFSCLGGRHFSSLSPRRSWPFPKSTRPSPCSADTPTVVFARQKKRKKNRLTLPGSLSKSQSRLASLLKPHVPGPNTSWKLVPVATMACRSISSRFNATLDDISRHGGSYSSTDN